MLDRLSVFALESMARAHTVALGFHHDRISCEHVLLGALRTPAGGRCLVALGVSESRLVEAIQRRIVPGERVSARSMLPFTRAANRALEHARDRAKSRATRIDVPDIIAGLFRERDSIAAHALAECGLTDARLARLRSVLPPTEEDERG